MKLGWVRQVFELSEVELTEFHCNLNHNARVQLAFIPTDRLISLVSGKTSNGYMSVAASYNWIIYLIILAAVQSAMPEFRARLESRLRTPEQGADTVIWLALAQKAISRENGLFYQGKPSLTYSPTDTSFHVCLTYSPTDTSFLVCLTYSPTDTSFHVCLTYSPTDTSFHVCLKLFWFMTGSFTVSRPINRANIRRLFRDSSDIHAFFSSTPNWNLFTSFWSTRSFVD